MIFSKKKHMIKTPFMSTHQLLREWPPGYGGVERVAHELGVFWGGVVWSFDAQGASRDMDDPVCVSYRRKKLLRLRLSRRLVIPLPSCNLFSLLVSPYPLHGHLPSPAVFLVLLIAKAISPRRKITVHWHCFLEKRNDFIGFLYGFYQDFSLALIPFFSGIITTSPALRDSLIESGCSKAKIIVVPCSLSEDQESSLLAIDRLNNKNFPLPRPLSVLFIGRLDSYKRLDWLLLSLSYLQTAWTLHVVGDGPRRGLYEALSDELLLSKKFGSVHFYGRLAERQKLDHLKDADVLVLPSESSNEAFGIVQLEAMASGLPALSFSRMRSGMGWVCSIPSLRWSQSPDSLHEILSTLGTTPGLLSRAGQEARQRYLKLFSRNSWEKNLAQYKNFLI